MGTNPFDDELDRLLTGDLLGRDAPDELDVVVHDLRAAFPAAPLASEDLHVAAMTEASQLLADKGDPVARPVSNADAPATQASRLPKRRRHDVRDKKWKPILLKGMVPVFATLTLFSGMAWAGVLPGPLQGAADHVASLVGLSSDDPVDPTTTDDQGTTEDQSATDDTRDGTDAVDDNQGEDTQGTSLDQTAPGDTQDQTSADDDQGEDTQGEDTQAETSADDDQGEDTQGDTKDQTSADDNQGDTSTDATDSSGDSQDATDSSGDSQDATDTSGGGDSQD